MKRVWNPSRLCATLICAAIVPVAMVTCDHEPTATACDGDYAGVCVVLANGKKYARLLSDPVPLRYDGGVYAEYNVGGVYYPVERVEIKADDTYGATLDFTNKYSNKPYSFGGAVVVEYTDDPTRARFNPVYGTNDWVYWVPAQIGSISWYLDPGPPALKLTVQVKRIA